MSGLRRWLVAVALALPAAAPATTFSPWANVSAETLRTTDDDIARNIGTGGYFDGLEIAEYRFRENGFAWHLIRIRNAMRPDGPLWIVPHDDENAAFDAMIEALRQHGGVGIVVNSGPASVRRQTGHGPCGVRSTPVPACDPNRNFDVRTPLFTAAFLDQRPAGQPVIALHTNSPGFAGDGHGGRGDMTILDRAAWRRGVPAPRVGGVLAANPLPAMANYDTLGLAAFLARQNRPAEMASQCGRAIAQAGIHFWHEPVAASDGSMSNYLALHRPGIRYFNAESRAEADPAVAAARHKLIIAAYLGNCRADPSTQEGE